MPDYASLPTPTPSDGYILCISAGSAPRQAFHAASRKTAPRMALVDVPDTYAARDWLSRQHYGPAALPVLVLADYNPEEQWSLAVLLSQLQNHNGPAGVPVVLAAQGPAYMLPVSVKDYPGLTVVPADFHPAAPLANRVGDLVASACRHGGLSAHAE